MAVGLVFQGTGVTQDQYFQVFNQVTENGTKIMPGLIQHHAGPTDNGFCVIEVWESQEAVMRFFEEQLAEALAAANIDLRPKLFEIVNSLEPRGSTTAWPRERDAFSSVRQPVRAADAGAGTATVGALCWS